MASSDATSLVQRCRRPRRRGHNSDIRSGRFREEDAGEAAENSRARVWMNVDRIDFDTFVLFVVLMVSKLEEIVSMAELRQEKNI